MRLKKWVGLNSCDSCSCNVCFCSSSFSGRIYHQRGTITAESHPDCILMNEVFKYVEEQSEAGLRSNFTQMLSLAVIERWLKPFRLAFFK